MNSRPLTVWKGDSDRSGGHPRGSLVGDEDWLRIFLGLGVVGCGYVIVGIECLLLVDLSFACLQYKSKEQGNNPSLSV